MLLLLSGKKILIDLGSGTLYRLSKIGYKIDQINILAITHNHPDHLGDFLAFLHSIKWDPSLKKEKEIAAFMPNSVYQYYKSIIKFYGDSIKPDQKDFSFNIEKVSNSIYEIEDIIVKTILVEHTKDSVAYRFEYKGKSIVYTGDTSLNLSLIELTKKCDLLISECSYPTNRKQEGHICPEDIKILIEKARPKKIIITHVNPNWSEGGESLKI